MRRTALSTRSRWTMSPISNTKRLSARRSLRGRHRRGEDVDVVLAEHPRDVARAGPSGRAPRPGSAPGRRSWWSAPTRRRSSARGRPCSDFTFVQSARCTETPLPRVTKPTISSPGTGVQHFASLTRMSGAPRTSTPESPPRGCRGTSDAAGGRSARSSVSFARDERRHLLDHRLRGDVALADRGVERRHVLVAQLVGDLGEGVLVHQSLQRQVLPAHRARDRLLALLDRPLRGAPS